MEVDVVVVGAGPVGSNSARLLANLGHSVVMLEEHPMVGEPVQCAGLVTPRLFEHIPLKLEDLAKNHLRGGIVFAPNGKSIRFETERTQAIVMDRRDFDQRMARTATDAGVTLMTATKGTHFEVNPDFVLVRTNSESVPEIRCKLLVGADGIRGRVASATGLPAIEEILSAYEADLSNCNIPADETHLIPMVAGSSVAPQFFSWIIPIDSTHSRSGLAIGRNRPGGSAKDYYAKMFSTDPTKAYIRDAVEEYLIIGGIPLGLRKKIVTDRVMLVGDAAGMAKPTSGGGIYMGILGSEMLARHAHKAFETDRFSEDSLMGYDKEVRANFGKELRFGSRLRSVYRKFRDSDLDKFSQLLSGPRVRQVIESRGDIDYVSKLIFPLILAQPRLVPFFMGIILRRES